MHAPCTLLATGHVVQNKRNAAASGLVHHLGSVSSVTYSIDSSKRSLPLSLLDKKGVSPSLCSSKKVHLSAVLVGNYLPSWNGRNSGVP